MNLWLLEESVLAELDAMAKSDAAPTDLQMQEFAAATAASQTAAGARITRTQGNKAEIRVDGVLTERPNLFAMMLGLGGTSYAAIRSALAQADADPDVAEAELVVQSPGGNVEGLFNTIAAIKAFSKPLSVRASNAQSAAYSLAAAAGPIEATGPEATFGSVGVVAGFMLNDRIVQITNSDSPKKRPDVSTEQGKATVREYLDAVHELFVGAIAEGRSFSSGDKGITPKLVTEQFGRGATVLAARAKELKMIDRIAPQARRTARVNAATPSASAINSAETASTAQAVGGWVSPLADARRRCAAELERNRR